MMDSINTSADQWAGQLWSAMKTKNWKLATKLIESEPDVDCALLESDYPFLYMAVEGGNDRLIELLLERGANPNTSNTYHELRVLYSAISAHNPTNFTHATYNEILQQLLADSNRIPVFEAVLACGSVSTLRLFSEHGVDLHNCSVPFPLHEAAKNRNKGLLKHLFNSNLCFDLDAVDEFGNTPVHVASLSGNHENLEQLLIHGADPNLRSPNGDSALLFAIENRSPECVEILLNYDARLFQFYGTNRLSMLLMAYTTCNDDIIISVVKSVVLMESSGKKIEDNERWVINKFERLREVYDTCRAEIEAMRKTVIRGCVTFYDVLVNCDVLVSFHRSVVDEIDARDFIEQCFPVYGDRIRYRVMQMRRRLDFISKATPALEQILRLNPDTFHMIYSKVVSFLSWKDLYHLRDSTSYSVDDSSQDLIGPMLTLDRRSMIVNQSYASEDEMDFF